jgi:hypothetical protein
MPEVIHGVQTHDPMKLNFAPFLVSSDSTHASPKLHLTFSYLTMEQTY